MIKSKKCLSLYLVFFILFATLNVACASNTNDCKGEKALTTQEVESILTNFNVKEAKVLEIKMSPVNELWEVVAQMKGQPVPAIFYIDCGKKYLLQGSIIELSTKANKTGERMQEWSKYVQEEMDKKRIDLSQIPLEHALVMGDKNAPKKVIIFTDPECPYCARLDNEMRQVVEKRKDIVFYIKLYPLPMHPDAKWKAESIVCMNSLQMLQDNFAKKPITKKECGTTEIDDNIKLGQTLGITGTPAIILPDGRKRDGTMPADQLIELIDGKK